MTMSIFMFEAFRCSNSGKNLWCGLCHSGQARHLFSFFVITHYPFLGQCKPVTHKRVLLPPRHDRRHTLMPSNINFRANIWALKQEGCTHIIATTACGSLQEDFAPGDIVLLDQFIDRYFATL